MSLVVASSEVKKQESVCQSLLQAYDDLHITAKSVAAVSAAVILYQTEPTICANCLTVAAVALTCSGVSKLSSVFYSTLLKFANDLNEIGHG